MSDGVARAFDSLREAARKRCEALVRGRTRVTVQVGHCSQSVGAADVLEAVRAGLPDDAYLVVAGCDGACFAAPQVLVTHPTGGTHRHVQVSPQGVAEVIKKIAAGAGTADSDVAAFMSNQRRIGLRLCGEVDCTEIDDYVLNGGYEGLARALAMPPEEVISEVKASGLRGRGGAYFPAALKWEGVRAMQKGPRFLVVNSEEGEPGVFKDRHLMEGVSHRVLEGAIIAAYASGVERAYVYVNAEANLSADRMGSAIGQAYDQGLLGKNILESTFGLDVEMRRGAGGYVCGEETTLLNTLEGRRREPRLRPPFPTEAGLLSLPTVINNTETLSAVPFILANGADAFATIGTADDKGSKIVSLSGAVRRAGVAEVPFGTTLQQIVYDIGGGIADGRSLAAVAVGGPSSGILPPSMLDTPIRPGLLHDSGVMLGAGGVIALDESVDVVEAVRALAAYNAAESCGKCTPCREGTPRMVEAIDRLTAGRGSQSDLEELRYLADVVKEASLCGLGQAAGGPITSGLNFFGDRFAELAGIS